MAFGKRPSNDRGDCSPPKSLKDGIKMVCSNTKCQFKNTLMHRECFEHLENYLVKIMSAMGSARAWTDAQRRSNLWDKKGLSLIQKLCRCKCGMADDREATPKTRKSKTKKLPKLNFNGPSTAALTDEKSNSENFITKRKQHLPYPSSTSSSTSSSHYRSNSLNLQSSTKLTFSRASERLSGQNSNTSNTPHQSGWHFRLLFSFND
ncbi:unnamed protein product [Anisakis simplex]|uniref:Headcase middle domain-containing protein n=1 Tax=Anisakis simplex TaxID=6269 RepID=A0A0M3KCG2_ANISI|nr:unnamed protein product [Anisakis simplex]